MQHAAPPTAVPCVPRPSSVATVFSTKRLLPLDGVRGIAILLILVHHFFPARDLPTVLGRWGGRFVLSSWFGVDLFFVLSGFLITGILFDAKSDKHFFRNFYARRTLRIFPLYYGVLIVTLVLIPLAARLPLHLDHQAWLWLYGTNLYPLIHHSSFQFPSPLRLEYGHFWSLAVEEHFYLVWPLVVFLFPRKTLMWVATLGALTALILRIVFFKFAFGNTHFGPDVLYQTTFLRMDGLLLGGWVALAVRNPKGTDPLLIPARWVAAITGVILAGMFFADGGLYRGNRDIEIAGYSLLAIFFSALLFPMISQPANLLQRLLAMGWLRFFGRYSYGLYVFHELLRRIFFPHDIPAGLSLATAGRTLMAFVASILISVVSFHLYERKFLGLKRFF